ncbi:MAG: hypothetical protein SGJ19_13360 [Planctomycetia bacterium]|nr:hypothetical protein [Planctomycetia bacterium]
MLAASARFAPFSGGYPCCCGDDGGGSSGSSGGGSTSTSTSSTSSLPIETTGCVFCAGGLVAEYYQVEISGMAEHTNCDDCAALDGVYIVGPVQQTSIGGDPFDCSDAFLLTTVCGGSDEPGCYGVLALQFYQTGGAFRVLVTLRTGATPCGQGGGQPTIEWEKNYGGAAPDCLLENELLPFITNGVPTTERCDGSAATCIVTAIPAP